MVLDIKLDEDSITVQISDPFRPDLDGIMSHIQRFASRKGADISGLNLKRLIPKMIRGIAGCEHGCPADAKGLVSRGFEVFELQYIEGGILSAQASIAGGRLFILKMFPDF